MKRIMKFVSILIIILIAMTTITVNTFAKAMGNNKLFAYSIDSESLIEYIENSEAVELEDISSYHETYEKDIIGNSCYIKRTWINEDGAEEYNYAKSGLYRIGALRVTSECIDFLTSKIDLEEYMYDNGVDAKVEKAVILDVLSPSAVSFPTTIWIKTDIGNYYVTVTADLSNISNTLYTLYSKQEFCNKFEVKYDGVLKVNESIKRNNIKFQYNGAYLPVCEVMRELGADVKLNEKDATITFIYNGKKYLLELNYKYFFVEELGEYYTTIALTEIGSGAKHHIIDLGTASGFCEIANGEVIMDQLNLNAIFKLIGCRIEIEANSRTANIYGQINVYLNNEKLNFDKAPFMKSERVLVPMRAIFEALGADVEWDNDTQTATAVKGNNEISITIGEKRIFKNGIEVPIDVGAQLIDDGWTFVPLRAVSEAFGCEVTWNEEANSVEIQTNK